MMGTIRAAIVAALLMLLVGTLAEGAGAARSWWRRRGRP